MMHFAGSFSSTSAAKIPAILGLLFFLAGCSSEAEEAKTSPKPPTEVGIIVTKTEDVSLITELAGRTAAYEASEVRPQVSGVVQERLFTEGATVQKGDVLYQIDSSLFEAAVAEARANVASAKATDENARGQADRLRPLVQKGVVSEQAFTNAAAAANTAAAAVAQSEAQLQTAEINLRFSRVAAPIAGRIGRSVVTTGALVSAAQTESLTTIQRLDPIFVDIQQSSTSLLKLRGALASSKLESNTAEVRLKLEDGSDYPLAGTLKFTEVTVSPDTGSVTLRAEFPNPDGLLLPGMYVRAQLSQAQARDAILVPQQGVTRNPRGEATALLVDADYKVEQRRIEVGRAVGDRWLVTGGLAAGDRVIVEGVSKVKPGAVVRPVEADLGGTETDDAVKPVASL
ncbi:MULTISPECIES: efflux RND transporter periplasmic adaptor subunit [unclassified Aureimonas]|uniref:efflux RND transporter periplasmic adaptor subunit n=1 Tax=unclassified Aureimonas TaxID=2615206 RepID=UPI000A97FD86|nr:MULTISPECIES: efflux RND transporter periplasmic adaptor subunit [unclassified Aureimonas]